MFFFLFKHLKFIKKKKKFLLTDCRLIDPAAPLFASLSVPFYKRNDIEYAALKGYYNNVT